MAKESLADKFLRFNIRKDAWRHMAPPGYVEQLQSCIRTARRVNFNVEASLLVELLILDHPRMLLQSLENVRWPFEALWIETAIDTMREQRNIPGNTVAYNGNGMFINQDVVYTVSEVPPSSFVVGWERYHINSSWSRDQQDEFFDHYKIDDRFRWIFGRFMDSPGWKDLTETDYQLLLDNVQIEMGGMSDQSKHEFIEREAINKVTLGAFLLLPLACMLLLNTPKLITEIHVPASRHFSSGKLRRFNEHTEISINVTTDEAIHYISEEHDRRNSEAEIARRRLHEVRGHFAHNQVARTAACVHTWIKDDERHFHCATCGGRRWWRPHHERGDEALGRIPPRQYRIT